MIFPGHLGAGYLTAYGVIDMAGVVGVSGGLSSPETAALLIAGTLLGIAPDLDILFYFISKKTLGPGKLDAHRRYLTHVPLLWLIAGLGIFLIASLVGAGIFWQILGLLVWLCPWSHFICDSIDTGIMWLWPFSKKQFAIYNSQDDQNAKHISGPKNWRELFSEYAKNPLAYIEAAITLVAIYIVILSL